MIWVNVHAHCSDATDGCNHRPKNTCSGQRFYIISKKQIHLHTWHVGPGRYIILHYYIIPLHAIVFVQVLSRRAMPYVNHPCYIQRKLPHARPPDGNGGFRKQRALLPSSSSPSTEGLRPIDDSKRQWIIAPKGPKGPTMYLKAGRQ